MAVRRHASSRGAHRRPAPRSVFPREHLEGLRPSRPHEPTLPVVIDASATKSGSSSAARRKSGSFPRRPHAFPAARSSNGRSRGLAVGVGVGSSRSSDRRPPAPRCRRPARRPKIARLRAPAARKGRDRAPAPEVARQDLRHRAAPAPHAPQGSGVWTKSVSPAPRRSIHSTMSVPVTSSVTPCSTCRRALTSRKCADVAVRVVEELDGAGGAVVDAFHEARSGLVHGGANAIGHPGHGGLFEDLLVASLHGAVAITENDHALAPSPKTWTSTWRAARTKRSRNRRSSPKLLAASAATGSQTPRSASDESTCAYRCRRRQRCSSA